MPLRKCLMVASVSSFLFPKKVYANNNVFKSSYHEIFHELNKKNEHQIMSKYRQELSDTFGHQHIISKLKNDIIDELHTSTCFQQ